MSAAPLLINGTCDPQFAAVRERPGIGPRGAALGVAAGGGRRPDWLE